MTAVPPPRTYDTTRSRTTELATLSKAGSVMKIALGVLVERKLRAAVALVARLIVALAARASIKLANMSSKKDSVSRDKKRTTGFVVSSSTDVIWADMAEIDA